MPLDSLSNTSTSALLRRTRRARPRPLSIQSTSTTSALCCGSYYFSRPNCGPGPVVAAGRVHRQCLRPTGRRQPSSEYRRTSALYYSSFSPSSPGIERKKEGGKACHPTVQATLQAPLIIFVRAYKQLKRQRLSQQEKNRRGRVKDGGGTMRETYEVDNVDTPKTGRRLFGSLFSRNRKAAASRFPPPVAIMTGESRGLSQSVREMVEDWFHRERGDTDAYGVRHTRETSGMGATVPAVPVAGKIERMTGNVLSNDLYTHRASGTAPTRGDKTPTHRQSVEEWSKLTRIAIPRTPPPRPIEQDSSYSPMSHATDETSAVNDLSPNYENILGLSAPPPVATTLIDRRYPNVAALARANIPSANRGTRLSYTYSRSNLTEHISTQYNPTSRSRRATYRSSRDMVPLLNPPLSAAFGGFKGGLKTSKGKGKQVSRDSVESATPEHLSVPSHRRSWSGRSVLELDDPEHNTEGTPQPPPPLPPLPTDSNPQPTLLPKFATTPRLRTSAVGSPSHSLLPPALLIPPSTPDISRSNHPDVALSRAHSISKRSIASIPSTISSFNAVAAPVNPIHGLSPTPPRLASPPAAGSGELSGRSIGTLIADTSEVSNFTERELEMEMARIRDRAKRASDERRRRGREEQRRRGGGPSSSS
ncbi:hypothetical protein HOY80DRAFT_193881 [Tuber brumale]|nr:hypothetical protein HOY80DRAFT_193881 [Tuber brumale]